MIVVNTAVLMQIASWDTVYVKKRFMETAKHATVSWKIHLKSFPWFLFCSKADFFYISPENVCHPNPCKNGATCNPAESSFDCECVKGWTGPLCEGMSFNALHLLLLRKVFNSLVLSLEILDAKLYGFHESNYTAFVKFLNETINPGVWKVHVVIDRRSKKSL